MHSLAVNFSSAVPKVHFFLPSTHLEKLQEPTVKNTIRIDIKSSLSQAIDIDKGLGETASINLLTIFGLERCVDI